MNRGVYGLEKMCKYLGVGRASYYRWVAKQDARQAAQKAAAALDERVKALFEASKGTYGAPRIAQALKRQQLALSVSRVARIMARLGLRARKRARYMQTTDSDHSHRIFSNILARQFNQNRPNQVWLSDITYLRTQQGWAYLTVVLDLADRMVVGWSLSDSLQATHTTVAALNVTLARRRLDGPVVLHSDRGVQYACSQFTQRVARVPQITQSMSRKGNCWDNAPMESFFKTLKTEWTDAKDYKDLAELKSSLFEYIECWYNTRRIHSTLDYKTPLETFKQLTTQVA